MSASDDSSSSVNILSGVCNCLTDLPNTSIVNAIENRFISVFCVPFILLLGIPVNVFPNKLILPSI